MTAWSQHVHRVHCFMAQGTTCVEVGWCVRQAQYNGNSSGFSYQYAVARLAEVAMASASVMLLVFIASW